MFLDFITTWTSHFKNILDYDWALKVLEWIWILKYESPFIFGNNEP